MSSQSEEDVFVGLERCYCNGLMGVQLCDYRSGKTEIVGE
jgi:hypothetical protein